MLLCDSHSSINRVACQARYSVLRFTLFSSVGTSSALLAGQHRHYRAGCVMSSWDCVSCVTPSPVDIYSPPLPGGHGTTRRAGHARDTAQGGSAQPGGQLCQHRTQPARRRRRLLATPRSCRHPGRYPAGYPPGKATLSKGTLTPLRGAPRPAGYAGVRSGTG
jgi:hypothetical protein